MYTENNEPPGAGFAGGGSVGRGRASGFDRSPLQRRLGTVVVVVVDLVAVGDVLCRVHARRVIRPNVTCVDASTERERRVDGRSPGLVRVWVAHHGFVGLLTNCRWPAVRIVVCGSTCCYEYGRCERLLQGLGTGTVCTGSSNLIIDLGSGQQFLSNLRPRNTPYCSTETQKMRFERREERGETAVYCCNPVHW